jgi:hypothetical protein
MKEMYQKERLPREMLEKLRKFVVSEESNRVTPRFNKDDAVDE